MSNARYWTCVIYPEHLIDDWEELAPTLIQIPFCYIVHNKDNLKDFEEDLKIFTDMNNDDIKNEINKFDSEFISKAYKRKVHIHFILAFNNTTTYKNALSVINTIMKKGEELKYIKRVQNIRHIYDYLIHATEKAIKDKKHLYSPDERIEVNNFDIGAYERLSAADKKSLFRELKRICYDLAFTNYADWDRWVTDQFQDDERYIDVAEDFSSHFDKIIRGNYHKATFDLEMAIKKSKIKTEENS